MDGSASKRIHGPSKIKPGGSQGHQNSFSEALRAANWAAISYMGTHFDTQRVHLGIPGSHLAVPGAHFGARVTFLGAQGMNLEGPGAPHGRIFS